MEQKPKKIKPMVRLSQSQIDSKKEFIRQYIEAENASSGSTVDSNANVSVKTVATLGAELNKDIAIQVNRSVMCDYIEKYFDRETAEEYVRLLEEHTIYKHDETSVAPMMPYCTSINMYPFLESGMTKLGGESTAPKHLESFCGSFINLIFAISSQFAGACNGYNQRIIFEKDDVTYSKKFGDFVNSFSLDKLFSNYQGDWEYADISNQGYKVSEDGRFVNINKVYRRKYNKKLYKIKTASGYSAEVSEDHIFKVILRGRELEVKAKDLIVNDTVFMNKDQSMYLHKDNDEFKKGFLVGIICGDGSITDEPNVRLSVNKDQMYILDIVNGYLTDLELPNLSSGKENRGCVDCRKRSQELFDFLKSYIIGNDTYTKHIDVEKYSLDFLVGFLDGLFMADGSYSESRGISVSLTNRALIDNVRDIVDKLYISMCSTKTIPAKGGRRESYNLYVGSRIIKYLLHTPTKLLKRGKIKDIDCSREIYYYGKYAFQHAKSSPKTLVKPISYSNQEIEYHVDVISEIELIDNYDEYVYEIETETHWYNDGGFITHNCATPEALLYFHYFAQKDYGKDYLKTHPEMVKAKLQHLVFSINQPAASRGYQSTFWNLSMFDKYFFESMFGHFYFPDGTHLEYDGYNELQKFFMEWLLEERKKSLLTFPVLTEASLDENNEPKDKDWADFCADIRSRGLSFFSYNSNSVDALASCCRLRNAVEENDFSYSLGAGGVETGSHSVMTIDLVALFGRGYDLEDIIRKVHKFQYAHRMLVQDGIDAGLLPAYSAGFIHLDKQFSTLGVNGLNEAAEERGLTVGNNKEYKEWVANVLGTFKRLNMEARSLYNGAKYNTELVPAENLGVKNAKWDKKAGLYHGTRECYNSYMYLSESDMTSIPDKFELHGSPIADNLDGGSALHLNLSRLPDKEFFLWLRKLAAKYKCNYWTTNVKGTVCNDCGHHDMDTFEECPKCGSKNVDYHTRVIGYCKKISAFSGDRKKEEKLRYYH